jgi:IgGFc binding protein
MNPDQDFDHTSSNEDLRSFLTVVGAQKGTHMRLELGAKVLSVVPTPSQNLTATKPGDVLELDIGPYDVINLETAGLNADFTGTRIHTSQPVAVFVGSEASDVPTFGTYATRQCCADHLEEQLLPDRNAGNRFVLGRMPPRAKALNNAALPGAPINVAEVDEPEWIRVVSTSDAPARVQTTLDPPDNDFMLMPRGDAILKATRDFVIEADKPIHVLEALASQGVTGIPKQYPGGDPSIIAVPPVEQFRRDYIFLTPDKYAFDFVTMVAPVDAHIQLDGAPLPDTCESTEASKSLMSPTGSAGEWLVHRCQLSFPEVTNGMAAAGLMGGTAMTVVKVLPGEQHDGAHTVVSDQPISIIVYGFDRFVSYAYVGGLNLTALN